MRASKHLPSALSAARHSMHGRQLRCALTRKRRLRRAFQCTYVSCGALFNAHTSVAARFLMRKRRLRRAFQCTNVGCSTPLNTHTSVAARLSMHKRRLQHASQCTYVNCGTLFNAQTPVAAHVSRMTGLYGAGLKPCKATHPIMRSRAARSPQRAQAPVRPAQTYAGRHRAPPHAP